MNKLLVERLADLGVPRGVPVPLLPLVARFLEEPRLGGAPPLPGKLPVKDEPLPPKVADEPPPRLMELARARTRLIDRRGEKR